jgi:chromosome segregation ATPase
MEEILKQILTELKEVKNNQGEMQKDINGLKEDMSTLKADVSGIKSDVSELKETTARIDNNLKYVKDITVNLKADIIELNSISKDGFETMDEKIANLQFDVNNLTIKTNQTDNKVILFEKLLKSNEVRRG